MSNCTMICRTCLTKLQGKDADKALFSITLLKILSALCREYQTTTQQITHHAHIFNPHQKTLDSLEDSPPLRILNQLSLA